jgi:hypothetical protein
LIVVLYDNDIPGMSVDRVFVENRKASARLVDHLHDLGHGLAWPLSTAICATLLRASVWLAFTMPMRAAAWPPPLNWWSVAIGGKTRPIGAWTAPWSASAPH